jgi:hypothetical protein
MFIVFNPFQFVCTWLDAYRSWLGGLFRIRDFDK